MYDVEAKVTYTTQHINGQDLAAEWDEIVNVDQMETEQAELQEARRLATEARKYYTAVRIVKINPGGSRTVVS